MIPKFRAWDKETEVLREVLHISFETENIVVDMGYADVEKTTKWDALLIRNKYVLMQSTGLKDKNGVEIFEGDIVENTTQLVYLGHRFEVTWNKNYASYQLMNNGLSSNIPLIQDFMSYEVVGNIYENPELLEVE